MLLLATNQRRLAGLRRLVLGEARRSRRTKVLRAQQPKDHEHGADDVGNDGRNVESHGSEPSPLSEAQLASSTALNSRMTVTLIWPGKVISRRNDLRRCRPRAWRQPASLTALPRRRREPRARPARRRPRRCRESCAQCARSSASLAMWLSSVWRREPGRPPDMASAAATKWAYATGEWLVGVVRADGVGDDLALAKATGVVGTDDRVRSVELVGERLADVVQQRRPAGDLDVEAQLGGQHSAKEPRLHTVLPLILRVAGSEVEPADQLDDVGVRAVELQHGKTTLPEIDDLAIHLCGDFAGGLGEGIALQAPVVRSMRPTQRRATSRPTPSRPSMRMASPSSVKVRVTPETPSTSLRSSAVRQAGRRALLGQHDDRIEPAPNRNGRPCDRPKSPSGAWRRGQPPRPKHLRWRCARPAPPITRPPRSRRRPVACAACGAASWATRSSLGDAVARSRRPARPRDLCVSRSSLGQRALAIRQLLANLIERAPLFVGEHGPPGQRRFLLGQLDLARAQRAPRPRRASSALLPAPSPPPACAGSDPREPAAARIRSISLAAGAASLIESCPSLEGEPQARRKRQPRPPEAPLARPASALPDGQTQVGAQLEVLLRHAPLNQIPDLVAGIRASHARWARTGPAARQPRGRCTSRNPARVEV